MTHLHSPTSESSKNLLKGPPPLSSIGKSEPALPIFASKKFAPITASQTAHIVSTSSIASRKICQQSLEGSNPLELFPKIQELSQAAVQSGAPPPSPAFNVAFGQVIHICELANKINGLGTSIAGRAEAFAGIMESDLKALKIGETLTIPGGWQGRNRSGHAMLYKFERTGPDAFTVTIYNSGAGLEYHPSQVKKDGKRRFILSLPYKDVPLEKVINKDVWSAYFQIMFGRSHGEEFSAKTLYEGLFPQLIPNFSERYGGDQDLTKAKYLREQTGGICTAQSLFTLLRECVGERYHELRDRVRTLALNNRTQGLEASKVLGQGEADAKENLQSLSVRKGTIQLLNAEVERTAGDIHRDVTKRAPRFADPQTKTPVEENLSVLKHLSKKIEETASCIKNTCIQLLPFTSTRITGRDLPNFCPTIHSIPADSETPSPLIGPKLLLDLEKPKWSASPEEITKSLKACSEIIGKIISEGSREGVSLWLQDLFRTMPSFTEEPWQSLPPTQQMECIEQLTTLSGYLVGTHLSQKERDDAQSTVEACLFKASAILTLLIRKQPGCQSMGIPTDLLVKGQEKPRIPSSVKLYEDENTHKVQLWRANAGFYLSDPKLSREYSESLLSLATMGSSWFIGFRRFFFDNEVYSVSSPDGDNQDLNKSQDEFEWVKLYLQQAEHADTLKQIKKALRIHLSGDKDIDQNLILAEALSKPEKYFPNTPLWALLKQTSLHFMLKAKLYNEWVERTLKTRAWNEKSLLKLNVEYLKKDFVGSKPVVRLFSGLGPKAGPDAFYDASPEPYPARFGLSAVCRDWSTGSYTSKQLLLKQPAYHNNYSSDEELLLVGLNWMEDPQHAAMKAIAFYRKHMSLLTQPLHQWALTSCLFSPGILHTQLQHPIFATALEDFVHYGYLQAKADIPTALFFLNLGDKLQNYCRETISKPTNFPSIASAIPSLEDKIKNSASTPIQKKIQQALLSATVLANYGNGEMLWQKDPEELLFHAFRFADCNSYNESILSSFDLPEQMTHGYLNLAKFIKKLHEERPEECQQLLSRAVAKFSDKKMLSLRWEGFNDSFPILYTPKREFQINLFNGQIWQGVSREGMIPSSILRDPTFQTLFPNIGELREISSTPRSSSFLDKNGVRYKAYNWIGFQIDRQINGEWYHYIPNPPPLLSQALQDPCICWGKEYPIGGGLTSRPSKKSIANNPLDLSLSSLDLPKPSEKRLSAAGDLAGDVISLQGDEGRKKTVEEPIYSKRFFHMLLIDPKTGKKRYSYKSDQLSLEWVGGKPSKTKLYAVPQKSTPLEDFFRSFDPQPQLWRDKDGHITLIELPNYKLLFDVTYPPSGEPILTCREHPGYHLAKQQFLPQLLQSSGHLILVKDSEEASAKEEEQPRIVLMPKKNLSCDEDLTTPLLENWTSFNYYVYELNSQGELDQPTNLEARLYLAYLYTMLGEYKRAEKLLYTPHESLPLGAYSEEALSWLENIAQGKGTQKPVFNTGKNPTTQAIIDRNLHAAALRLQAFMLKSQNVEEWVDASNEPQIPQELDSCIQSQSRLPQDVVSRIKASFPHPLPSIIEIDKSRDSALDWQDSLISIQWSTVIDPDILKKPFILEPNNTEMGAQFLSLYAIANDRSPEKAPDREALKRRLKMIHGNQHHLAEILLGCLTAKDEERDTENLPTTWVQLKWPSTGKMQNLLHDSTRDLYGYSASGGSYAVRSTMDSLLTLAKEHSERFTEQPKITTVLQPPPQNSEIETKERSEQTFKQPIPLSRGRAESVHTLTQTIQNTKEGLFKQWDLFQQSDQKEKNANLSWQEVTRRLEPDLKASQEDPIAEYAAREIHEILQDQACVTSPQHTINFTKLSGAKTSVAQEIDTLTSKIDSLQSQMLDIARKPSKDWLVRMQQESAVLSGKKQPIDLSTLLLCYLKGDFSFYRNQNPALSEAEIQQLHALTEEFLIQSTWKQQLQRAKDLITKLEKTPSEKRAHKNTELLAQKLFETLNAKREYQAHEHPEYLLYEYACDMLLYKEQVDQIETLIDNKQWTILEILMGKGKTDVLLPLVALRKADGKAIPVIMFADTLIKNFSPIIQRRLGTVFSQNLVRINWDGTKPQGLTPKDGTKQQGLTQKELKPQGLTPKELKRIRKTLESIPQDGSCLVVSQLDMHKLILQAKRAKIDLARVKNSAFVNFTGMAVSKWEDYQAILNLMRTKSQWMIDEIDLCLRPDFEMHQALDAGVSIDPSRTAVSYLLFSTLLQKFKEISFDFCPKPGKQPCTLVYYQQNILPVLTDSLLEQLSTEGQSIVPSSEEIRKYRKEIEIYLKNSKADLPEMLNPNTKDTLAFLKFQIRTLMPLTLHKLHGQNYGRFPEKEGGKSVLAGPYHLKDSPCDGSQFGLYGEQINYTFEAYLKEGVTQQDVSKEILRLQNEVQRSHAYIGGNPTDLPAYKEFRALFDPEGRFDLMQIQAGQLQAIADSLSQDKLRLLRFVRLQLDRTLLLPKEQITSTAQQILHLCASAKGMSGTVYANRKTFPKQFTNIQTAKGLHRKEIECIKRNNTILSIPSQLTGTAFLDALLENDPREKIKAIIDVGALLTGASMNTLAKHLLEKRPSLQAVIYYENDVAWILKRNHEPILYNSEFDKQIDPANRFTLFDQKRCTGANILQDPEAEAYVTLNKTQSFRDLAQGAWRMRGIEKAQQVHLVVTDEIRLIMASAINKDPAKIDAIDLIDHTLRVQAQQQARNGVKMIKQQIRDLFEETCDALLSKVPPAQWQNEPYKSLVLLSITEVSDNPYEKYGKPTEDVAAEKVLAAYGNRLLDRIAAWNRKFSAQTQFLGVEKALAGSKEQLQKIVEAALKEEIVPKKIPTQQNVESEQEVTTEVEKETDIEQEMEVEEQQSSNSSRNIPIELVPWPSIDDLCQSGKFVAPALNEKEITDLRSLTTYFWERREKESAVRPPILNANDALRLNPQAQGLMEGINLFSDNLFVSANIPFLEKFGTAFGLVQDSRSRCLINQGADGTQMLLLEPKDSESVFREMGQINQPGHAFALYDYTLGPKKAGMYATGSSPIQWDQLNSKPQFKELFVQYKFFCGELNGYSPEELEVLKNWLKRYPAKLGSIEALFKKVLLTQKMRASYHGSVMALCFKELAHK